jgi:hypothetical protein
MRIVQFTRNGQTIYEISDATTRFVELTASEALDVLQWLDQHKGELTRLTHGLEEEPRAQKDASYFNSQEESGQEHYDPYNPGL